jgi:hypothetical protein
MMLSVFNYKFVLFIFHNESLLKKVNLIPATHAIALFVKSSACVFWRYRACGYGGL